MSEGTRVLVAQNTLENRKWDGKGTKEGRIFFILLIFIHASYVHGSITIQIKVKCGRILRTV